MGDSSRDHHRQQQRQQVFDGNVFEQVRRTCAHAVKVSQSVHIDDAGLRELAKSLDGNVVNNRVRVIDQSENAKVDVSFRTVSDNVNYRAIYGLMQLGHGYRYELHRTMKGGAGASKTITRGINSLASSSVPPATMSKNEEGAETSCGCGNLSAANLASLSKLDIQKHFDMPDSYIEKEPALSTLVDQIHQCLSQTGGVLQKLGYKDMNDFVLATLNDARRDGKPPAASLVLAFKRTFLCMDDVATLHDGSEVWLLKKAILSTYEIDRAVGCFDDRYALPDINNATAIIDNVIPAMLVRHGALALDEQLSERIKSRKLLPRGEAEAELRAVAVAALEQLANLTGIGASTLSNYFWLIGKDGDNRDWPRHHTQDTIYY